MVITLYKGCRLNKSYCEVLDTIAKHTYSSVQYDNALEAYLSTLEKLTITTVEDIFGSNKGNFSFELEPATSKSLYEYNYMKVVDNTGKFSRYYFINSITVIDALGVINYEEDVWANYSASMHVRNSLLTRSRSLKYGNYTIPFYKLGMEYEGNERLNFSSLKTIYDYNDSTVGECIIVAKLQIYQLVAQGEVGNIVSRVVALQYKKTGETATPYNESKIKNEVMELLTTLKQGQAIYSFSWDTTYKNTYKILDYTGSGGNNFWYYEIGAVYLVPRKFGLELDDAAVGFTMGKLTTVSLEFADVNVIDITRCFDDGIDFSSGRPLLTTYANITKNFKNLGIGTYSNIYEVVENGTNYRVDILMSSEDYNFAIYLNIQNKLINITDNFRVDIPLTVQTADATQQQRTARELEIFNNEMRITKSTIGGLFGGVVDIAGSVALGNVAKNVGTRTRSAEGISGGISQITSGIVGIASGVKGIEIANRNMYRTSKGTFTQSIGMTNAYYGLFLFSIDSDNDIEVQANIDNAGYVVNEIVGDLLQNMANANDKPSYNVMAFGFVNNYGAFPEDIRERFVDILSNGFKIWYDVASYIAS